MHASELGHLEFQVLEILWARGESNVRDVAEKLARPLAYTTVMTTLDRLFKKGFLDGSNIGPLIAIIAVGMCVGFLPYNFSGRRNRPARIIMGDAGALLLGLMLAVPTITVGGRTDVQFSGNTYFFFAPLVIPLVILGVPMVDTVLSFIRRVAKGRSFHQADKDHLRAEFAISTRRLEMSVEQLKARSTTQLGELGKKTEAIAMLKHELGEKSAALTAIAPWVRVIRAMTSGSSSTCSLRASSRLPASTARTIAAYLSAVRCPTTETTPTAPSASHGRLSWSSPL